MRFLVVLTTMWRTSLRRFLAFYNEVNVSNVYFENDALEINPRASK